MSLDERLLEAAVGTLELFGVHLGTRLGLYRALRDRGELTSGELAAVAGISERYAREWLEQQAVAGLLAVDDVALPPGERRYRLPAEHVGPLADPDDPAHVAPLADAVVGIAGALSDVVAAYRDGGGVPYPRYGPDFRRGQGGINRPAFRGDLTATWLPAVAQPATGSAEYTAQPTVGFPEYTPRQATAIPDHTPQLTAGFPEYSAQPATGFPDYTPQVSAGYPEYSPQISTGFPDHTGQLGTGLPEYTAQTTTGFPDYSSQLGTGTPEYAAQTTTGFPEYAGQLTTGFAEYTAQTTTGFAEYSAQPTTAYPDYSTPITAPLAAIAPPPADTLQTVPAAVQSIPAIPAPRAPEPDWQAPQSAAAPSADLPTVDPGYDSKVIQVLAFARSQIGKPCVWGAAGPGSYDNSGLTQAAWKVAGVSLPRTALGQASTGTAVSLYAMQPGDLVFFHDDFSHVGLCTGNGMMIHAPGPGASIREESIYPTGESIIRGAIRPV